MEQTKIKISQKDLDDIYEVTTEEPKTETIEEPKEQIPFLTKEEEEQDDLLEESLDWEHPE